MTKSLLTPFIVQILESLTAGQLREWEKPSLLNLSSNIDKSECSWDQEKNSFNSRKPKGRMSKDVEFDRTYKNIFM